jgi:hypothetical protein
VVAAIVTQMDTEATLKRFYSEKDHVRLEPASDKYPFIIVKPDDKSSDSIRARYLLRYPEKPLQIYSGVQPQIAGWAMALVRA